MQQAYRVEWIDSETGETGSTVIRDSVTGEIIAKLAQRSAIGVVKYGNTLDRKDFSLSDWLAYMVEELLDGAQYAHRAAKDSDGARADVPG